MAQYVIFLVRGTAVISRLHALYCYMKNFWNLTGLEQLNLKYLHVKITNLLQVVV